MNKRSPGGKRLNTARDIMSARVPVFAEDATVDEARARLPTGQFDSDSVLYVIDGSGCLSGTIDVSRLLCADGKRHLRELTVPATVSAADHLSPEHVATIAVRHKAGSVPVLDENGCFLGAVLAETLVAVLRHEHEKDLHRIAGILHDANHAAHALELSPLRRLHDRLPWLLVGLAGSASVAAVMAAFEQRLSDNVTIAFFVPALVYIADAIGTQTEAIAVRGLSLVHSPFRRILLQELTGGLLIGLVLALIAMPAIGWVMQDWPLALAVGCSIIGAGATATLVGLTLPWVLSRLGFDPALGSGPVATVIQDAISLLVYFGFVTLLVPRG